MLFLVGVVGCGDLGTQPETVPIESSADITISLEGSEAEGACFATGWYRDEQFCSPEWGFYQEGSFGSTSSSGGGGYYAGSTDVLSASEFKRLCRPYIELNCVVFFSGDWRSWERVMIDNAIAKIIRVGRCPSVSSFRQSARAQNRIGIWRSRIMRGPGLLLGSSDPNRRVVRVWNKEGMLTSDQQFDPANVLAHETYHVISGWWDHAQIRRAAGLCV